MRVLEKLTKGFDWVAGWIILASMFLVAGNVLLRLFGRPIGGTFEWTGLLTALAVSLALSHTALHGAHTTINMLVERLPLRLMRIDRIAVRILTAAFLGVAAWQLVVLGANTWRTGEVTPTTKIALYPFMFIVAAGVAMYAIVEVAKMLHLVLARDAEAAAVEEEHYMGFAPQDSCPLLVALEDRDRAARELTTEPNAVREEPGR